jgi:hypothetical protein
MIATSNVGVKPEDCAAFNMNGMEWLYASISILGALYLFYVLENCVEPKTSKSMQCVSNLFL